MGCVSHPPYRNVNKEHHKSTDMQGEKTAAAPPHYSKENANQLQLPKA